MQCMNCGKDEWRRATAPVERNVGALVFKGEVAAEICGGCGEALFVGADLERFEADIAVVLATHAVSTGEALKWMRKTVGLTAVELAKLLDVAPETLSRWETGERAAPRAVVVLLCGLVLDRPGFNVPPMDLLRLASAPSRLPRVTLISLPRAS